MVEASEVVEVAVPIVESDGVHYHEPGHCGGHLLTVKEMTVEELAETGLRACGNCVQHGNLYHTWVKVHDYRNHD